MSRRNNQNFVMLPHAVFVSMLRYKAQENGIEVVVRGESYNSQASSQDFDFVPVYGTKADKPGFSGKRIKRGLYKAADGQSMRKSTARSTSAVKNSGMSGSESCSDSMGA